jgi:hypothetical protein
LILIKPFLVRTLGMIEIFGSAGVKIIPKIWTTGFEASNTGIYY